MSERAKEVAKAFLEGNSNPTLVDFLSSLPEFNPPKKEWVKCSERMPEKGQEVFYGHAESKSIVSDRYNGRDDFGPTTYWMPRFVPAPPEPEESTLVKEIAAILSERRIEGSTRTLLLDAIKRHEGAKK